MMTQMQLKPKQPVITTKQIIEAVMSFLPQLPAKLLARTYHIKKNTGRHCTLISLQKYARDLFADTYKIPFDMLPVNYQAEINRMVSDAYYGMKAARACELG